MNAQIDFGSNTASVVQINAHLLCCDADFVPPLTDRVEIIDYARRIVSKATRFEAWSGNMLIGLVAAYCNDQETRIAYITSVSVLREWTKRGIAACLMKQCIDYAEKIGMRHISLDVAVDNTQAIKLYEKFGFVVGKADMPFVTMSRFLENEEEHE